MALCIVSIDVITCLGKKKQIATLEQVISVCVPWWSGVWQLWKIFGFGNEGHHLMNCCQPRFPGAFYIYSAYSLNYRGVIFFLGGPFTHTVCLEISKILLGKRISTVIFFVNMLKSMSGWFHLVSCQMKNDLRCMAEINWLPYRLSLFVFCIPM